MSQEYYNNNAQHFISDTIDVDMNTHYQRFLAHLNDGASILDAGCGSGRDSLAFKNMGYKVQAFDASSAMVEATRSLADVPVQKMTFQIAIFNTSFDGIWACASLLHVPRTELSTVLENLVSHLNVGGIIYASFKYGLDERQKGDRYFNDLTETSLIKHIDAASNLEIVEQWTSGDGRTGRSDEKWLNCLLRKISNEKFKKF